MYRTGTDGVYIQTFPEVEVNVDVITEELNVEQKFDGILFVKIRIEFVLVRFEFFPYHAQDVLHVKKYLLSMLGILIYLTDY